MLLDLLIGFILVVVVLSAAVVLLCAYMSLPLADRLNEFFRRIGLAGPSSDARAAGSPALGVVASPFDVRGGAGEGRGKVFAGGELWNASCPAPLAPELEEGDRVEVVYGDDLSVRVLRKAGGVPAPAGGGSGVHAKTTRRPSDRGRNHQLIPPGASGRPSRAATSSRRRRVIWVSMLSSPTVFSSTPNAYT